MNQSFNRRRFLASTAAALAAPYFLRAQGSPNAKLNIACIGTAGRAAGDIDGVKGENIVALCDVDEAHLNKAGEKFPGAKKYRDFRKMLEQKDIDAVVVGTPDHTHAVCAVYAMRSGRHVYCEKPLARTVSEVRAMSDTAAQTKRVTQMGNQIQSHQAYRTAVALVHQGAIGKVKEVHSWQSGAMGWILADDRPAGGQPVPAGVHWNDWLGVAPERPYQPRIYHSFNWRAWQDFSNGQLGDFGCHILDPVFMALKLTAPRTITAEDFQRLTLTDLEGLSSAQAEALGRLAFPLIIEPGATHVTPVSWPQAMAAATSGVSPPSEKESGVIFNTPITSGRKDGPSTTSR